MWPKLLWCFGLLLVIAAFIYWGAVTLIAFGGAVGSGVGWALLGAGLLIVVLSLTFKKAFPQTDHWPS